MAIAARHFRTTAGRKDRLATVDVPRFIHDHFVALQGLCLLLTIGGSIAAYNFLHQENPASRVALSNSPNQSRVSLVSAPENSFIDQLTAGDAVGCIGESHQENQIQEIDAEIAILKAVHEKSPNRPIALATERFTGAMQPQLEVMLKLPTSDRLAFLKSVIFELPDYKDSWGKNSPFYSENDEHFESMVEWAVQQGFALIGLDDHFKSDDTGVRGFIETSEAFSPSLRNPLWVEHTLEFLNTHKDTNYMIVAIGGYEHMNKNDSKSYCPALLQKVGLTTVILNQ